MEARSDLTFVIGTYNRRFLLETEVPRILELAKHAKVMIIDDGSEDDTFALLTRSFRGHGHVTLIRNSTNTGSAHCWNMGLVNSTTNAVFFLADDALELLPSVEQFVRTLTASIERYEIVGVHVVEQEDFLIPLQGLGKDVLYRLLYAFAGQVVSTNYGKKRECWFVPGILGVRTKAGRSLLFDDKLLIGNGLREESDFELRARRSGFRILYNPAIGVVHTRQKSGGQSKKLAGRGYTFWAIRNNLVFMKKNKLRLWQPRFVLFAIYQAILHGASPSTINLAMRDAFCALKRVRKD